jgi:hypothetical protein
MSVTDRAGASRHVTGWPIGKIVAALAVAISGVAIEAPRASAATACVSQTLGPRGAYQACVRDEQVLLNDLWYVHAPGPSQALETDGIYGSHTASDVTSFNDYLFLSRGPHPATTTPGTWKWLCLADQVYGFVGVDWQGAGCPMLAG